MSLFGFRKKIIFCKTHIYLDTSFLISYLHFCHVLRLYSLFFCLLKKQFYICRQTLTYCIMERQSTDIRQEQIKQAVIDIISTDGLKNLSTRNLALRIGMSEGSIFRHFKTKKDIILSIFSDIQENFIGELKKIAWSDEEASIRLFKYLSATIQYHIDNKGINMLLFSEASYNNDPEFKQLLQQIFHDQKQFIIKIIQDGINTGIWNVNAQVESAALICMGIPVSMNMEMLIGKKSIQIEVFRNDMLQLLLKMLKK